MENADKIHQESYYNDRWSQAQSEPINKLKLRRLIAILEEIHKLTLSPDPRIIDIGSGTGWLSSVLSLFGKTTAVELSPRAVDYARARYPHIEFDAGDIFEKIKPEPLYDLAVSQEVIEHVEDQAAFIDLVAGCLKPNGIFIFTTPNDYIQRKRTIRELEEWGLQPIENWIDRKQIKKLLKDKFEVLSIRSIIPGYGSQGFFRVLHSDKIRRILRHARIENVYLRCLLQMNCGLHLVCVARKRPTP